MTQSMDEVGISSSPELISLSTDDDVNAAPLHLHAMRFPVRLHGTGTPKKLSSNINASSSRSSSLSRSSRPTSRDPSPSPSDHPVLYMTASTSSRPSSLTGDHNDLLCGFNIDPDIFLDRHGLEELDLESLTSEKHWKDGHVCVASISGLPSVNERMSEESMDDCHAFTDLRNVIKQNLGSTGSVGGCSDSVRSRDGSVTGCSIMGDVSCQLETLEEFEEESEHSG